MSQKLEAQIRTNIIFCKEHVYWHIEIIGVSILINMWFDMWKLITDSSNNKAVLL
jgi:hypothetical protein